MDSEDLCVMFRAAYTDDFYHALRDALHAEVDSWARNAAGPTSSQVGDLWKHVIELESITRNPDATAGWLDEAECLDRHVVPIQQLLSAAREA